MTLFFSSLSPISTDKVISLCEKQLHYIDNQEKDEIEELIIKYTEPKRLLFWIHQRNREEAIEAIEERKTIGDFELNSPKEDVQYKWLNRSNKVKEILRLANIAKDNGEDKVFLNSKDCETLGYL
jgi:hypothetical protein